MKKINFIIALCLISANVFAVPQTMTAPVAATTTETKTVAKRNHDIHQYVQNLIDNAFTILNDSSLSKEQKVAKSETLMEKNLDINWMADFSLGRQRKNLSATQLNDYRKIYDKYVVKTYAQRIKDYGGEKITVKDVKHINKNNAGGAEEYAVATVISNPNTNNNISANFMVRKKDNNFTIFDIVTEVSLITAQRSEFSSIIVSQGIEALIKSLIDKTAGR